MNTTELIVSIVVGIGCCALGGLLACGLVVILMLLSMDIASWIAIAALAVGVGICRVPAVRRWLLAQFPMLKPAEPQSPLRKAKPKKR